MRKLILAAAAAALSLALVAPAAAGSYGYGHRSYGHGYSQGYGHSYGYGHGYGYRSYQPSYGHRSYQPSYGYRDYAPSYSYGQDRYYGKKVVKPTGKVVVDPRFANPKAITKAAPPVEAPEGEDEGTEAPALGAATPATGAPALAAIGKPDAKIRGGAPALDGRKVVAPPTTDTEAAPSIDEEGADPAEADGIVAPIVEETTDTPPAPAKPRKAQSRG